MDAIVTLLGDYTLRTVALGAILLGVTSGALGSFAVLRKQSLLGDTLSHAALPGIALGFLVAGGRSLSAVLAGALATGVLAALTMLLLVRRSRLKTDASLGVALSVYFAAGVVLLSFVQGRAGAGQAGLETFLFGQAAAILRSDLWIRCPSPWSWPAGRSSRRPPSTRCSPPRWACRPRSWTRS